MASLRSLPYQCFPLILHHIAIWVRPSLNELVLEGNVKAGVSFRSPIFFFVKDSPSGQPPGTGNRQCQPPPTAANRQPPTANHCSILFLWFCVLPMS